MIDDRSLIYISERKPKLGIFNLYRSRKLTDSASFPSLRFLGLGHCNVGVGAIMCSIQEHEIFAMCVKEISLFFTRH